MNKRKGDVMAGATPKFNLPFVSNCEKQYNCLTHFTKGAWRI
jgi:hypothetical protein